MNTVLGEEFVREVLFPVVRAGMDVEPFSRAVSDGEFKELMRIGETQSILPVIWKGLGGLNMRPERNQEMKRNRMRCLFRYYSRDESLKDIFGALESAGLSYVPLKGSVLQYLYPEPWMRTSSDIDVLVHEEDLESAVQAIEGCTDFRFDKRNYHDVSMVGTRLQLELHFSIKEHMEGTDGLLGRAWEFASGQEGGCRFSFTPEYQAFHVLAHMAYHMVTGGLGIRPYLDLWLLGEKTAYDENKLRGMCGECGLLTFYDTSRQLLRVWMEGAQHTAVTSDLEGCCLSGGVFGSGNSGARQREHRGASYVLHRLLARRDVLEGMYPGLREKPALLPYYQVRRLLRLVDPGKRRGAVAEVRRLGSVSDEAIDSFDSLLTSLGL